MLASKRQQIWKRESSICALSIISGARACFMNRMRRKRWQEVWNTTKDDLNNKDNSRCCALVVYLHKYISYNFMNERDNIVYFVEMHRQLIHLWITRDADFACCQLPRDTSTTSKSTNALRIIFMFELCFFVFLFKNLFIFELSCVIFIAV